MVALIRALATRRCRELLLVGLLVLTTLAALAGPGRKIDSLDFVDLQIPVALKALADVSGMNIVVAPDVKGSITLKLKDVTLDEALTLITSTTGLTYKLTGNTYVVMVRPPDAAPTATTAKLVNPVTLVVPLTYLSSADAIGALGISFKDVQVKEIPGRLVLYGEAKEAVAAKALLTEIDVPSKPIEPPTASPETAEATYTVKAVVPWQAKQYLEDLYKGSGLTIGYAPQRRWTDESSTDTPTQPAAKPGDVAWQSNALILRGPKDIVAQALASAAHIDMETPLVEKRCSVKRIYATQAIAYLLERYTARGLTIYTAPMTFSETVSKSDGQKDAAAVKGNPVGSVVRRDKDGALNVSEPIGDFILRGPEDVVTQAVTALAAVDVGPERVEKVVSLRFLKGSDAKKQLDNMYAGEGLLVTLAPQKRGAQGDAPGGGAGGAPGSSSSQAEVFVLVLHGPETVVARAQSLLLTLDTAPPQVSINSEIVSINSNEVKNLGVNWSGIVGTTTTPGSISIDNNESQSGDPLKIGRIVRAPVNINATLNALETQDKAKVINRPSTVVQNGEMANIHVGSQFFYAVVSAVTSTGPVYSQNSLNTGVTLQVRPLVSQDGLITLEITTNVTDEPTFRKDVSGLELPTILENTSTTVVQVRSGETLVIGGLMQSREEEHRQAIVGLGKLPIVGALFRNKRTVPSQSELVILVTPSIVGASAPAAPAAPTTGQ